MKELLDNSYLETIKDKLLPSMLLPELKKDKFGFGDSDDVFFIKKLGFWKCFLKFGHKTYNSERGWELLDCYKTRQRFLHFIKVPCKYVIICRGCGKTIN